MFPKNSHKSIRGRLAWLWKTAEMKIIRNHHHLMTLGLVRVSVLVVVQISLKLLHKKWIQAKPQVNQLLTLPNQPQSLAYDYTMAPVLNWI